MCERFMFFGVRSLLVLLLIKTLNYNQTDASMVYASFTGIAWLLSLFGGLFVDTLLRDKGPLKWACLLGFLGCLLIAVASLTALKACVFLGLILLAAGIGLFRPTLYAKLIELYPNRNDPTVDSGFVFLFVAINVGAFLAPLICATIGQKVHIGLGVLVAGLGMVAGLMVVRAIPETASTLAAGGTSPKSFQPVLFLYTVVMGPFLIASQYSNRVLESLQTSPTMNGVAMLSDGIFGTVAAILIPLIWLNRGRKGKGATTVGKLQLGMAVALIGTLVCSVSPLLQPIGMPFLIVIAGSFFLAIATVFIEPVLLAYVSKLAPAKRRATWIGCWMTAGACIPNFIRVGAGTVEWQGAFPWVPIGAVVLSIVLLVLFRERIQRCAGPIK